MRILFAGGGTGGHIHPNIAIAQNLEGHDISFIISRSKLDEDIIKTTKFKYKQIFSGKLRRYFSWHNFVDIPKLFIGIIQSFVYLIVNRPDKIFAKGGFVCVPLCFAGRILGIPIILHESDSIMGLSNRLIKRFATKLIMGIREGLNPIRPYVDGKSSKEYIQFEEKLKSSKANKILFAMGGSQGADQINWLIKRIFPKIKSNFFIVHLTGKGKKTGIQHSSYIQFEYLDNGFFDILKKSDLVISRAGAGSISELLFYKIPGLLIPLDHSAGDHQRKNAHLIEAMGQAIYIDPVFIDDEKVVDIIMDHKRIDEIRENLNGLEASNASQKIAKIIIDE